LLVLLEKGDAHLLEILLKPKLTLKPNQTYTVAREEFLYSREVDDPFLMNFVNTGKVSNMAYGTHIRSV
jgi:hypothetical protein